MASDNASTQPDLDAIKQRHHDWHHDPRGNQSIAEVVRDREALLIEVDRLQEALKEEHRWSRGWRDLAHRKEGEMQQAMNEATDRITREHGGYLRCETCHRREPLRSRYWRDGWPKCCGYTMRWWTQRQIIAGEVPE